MKEKVANEMQELIKINVNEEGQQLVSARELYLGLGLNKAHWVRWYEKNIQSNDFFEENKDWTGFTIVVNGNNVQDFAISIEFAKHIAMMARTEKSHRYRNYFIQCEKQLKNFTTNSYMIQDPVERAKRWIEEEQQRQLLVAQIEKNKPKVQFFDAVAGSKDSIEMGQVAKVLGIKGLGRNKLFELLRENKVLQKDNIPYQKYVDAGYFRVLEQKYTVPSGETKVNIKTMVFQKGVDYIRKLVQPS